MLPSLSSYVRRQTSQQGSDKCAKPHTSCAHTCRGEEAPTTSKNFAQSPDKHSNNVAAQALAEASGAHTVRVGPKCLLQRIHDATLL